MDAARSAGALVVTDVEGTPILRYPVAPDDASVGTIPTRLGAGASRPFERLFCSAGQARAASVPGERAVLVDRPLSADDVAALATSNIPLLLVVAAGPSRAAHSPAWTILRCAEAAAATLGARVIALPHPAGEAIPTAVLASFGIAHPQPLPAAPAASPRGTVVLFTGLSGAGKSTIARAVRDAVVETSDTPVTLLDGDVVRRSLSAELGFSPADRETNIRRIGWVAAVIAHHGGLVLCSPIAPYAATRAEVRAEVERSGGRFVLVHVATPLAECERRDSKGMYRRARAGEIADFTGISAPYEVPTDADLVLDTTAMTVADARDRVLDALSG